VVLDTPALVVIDVQNGLIEGFEEDWSDVLHVINGLVSRARHDGVPVVLVQHCGSTQAHPLHRTQPGWALHPAVDLQPGDLRVEKRWSDAFRDTNLDAVLREASVTRVVLVGAQTEYCVDTTARRAVSLGYDVDLVADGHTTSENGLLSRDQIIEHHNQTLANLAVEGVVLRVPPSGAVTFG
jgi:nicotinamidase-related amidase